MLEENRRIGIIRRLMVLRLSGLQLRMVLWRLQVPAGKRSECRCCGSRTDTAFWRCVRKIKEGIYNPEMLETLLLDYGASAYREKCLI